MAAIYIDYLNGLDIEALAMSDDEILGDDYEGAAPGHPSATAGPAVPLTNDGHIHGHKGMPPMAAGPELAEDALMSRVHALLRDADSHASPPSPNGARATSD